MTPEERAEVERLRAALTAIVNHEPEWTEPHIDNADCKACAEAERRQWPPSRLCEKHYGVLADNKRRNSDRRNWQWVDLKAIARAALATKDGES